MSFSWAPGRALLRQAPERVVVAPDMIPVLREGARIFRGNAPLEDFELRLEARLGTISADRERFMRWRTIEGEAVAPASIPQLEVLMSGVFEKRRFLDLIRHFIVFEEDPVDGSLQKKMAGYHQFHAVNIAIEETLRACAELQQREDIRVI